MYSPQTFAAALGLMILSTICWGSWANPYKSVRGYRFELFYWDFAIGIVFISHVFAFTLGGGHRPSGFVENMHSTTPRNFIFALVAGAICNFANLLLVAGIELAGMSVAFPVSIGIALVEGVLLSYAIQARGSAVLLAAGVACAVVAVVLDGKAYASLGRGRGGTSRKGLFVCVVSGLLMGTFAPFITRAMTSPPALGPYGAAVLFTVGAFLSCFIFNVYLMRRPLAGTPVGWSGYFTAPPRNHLLGFLSGCIWGTGTVLNFVAAHFTGVAISYAIGQASPMVAAFWGVFIFKEFAGADRSAKTYLTLMFAFYIVALVLVARAYSAG
jgi:glucose uptake protein